MQTKHPKNKKGESFRCKRCEKDFEYEFLRKHHTCIPDSKFACQGCDFRAVTLIELLDHTQSEHTKKVQVQVNGKESNPVKISCDKCDYKCHLNIQLKRK